MDIAASVDALWPNALAPLLMLAGLAGIWRGLRDSRASTRGLYQRQGAMLGLLQGFRLTVFGLALLGVGLALLWHVQWLLLLALGIGFVEILESSTLIAVWKWDRARPTQE